jgi:Nucleotide modification associated domain 1
MTASLDKTIQQYDTAFSRCKKIFLVKNKAYGTSWRVLRTRSVTDQLYIKAKRIRTIDETGEQKVRNTGDSIEDEFVGCVNYGIIGLIQLGLEGDKQISMELDAQQAEMLFDKYYREIKDLMIAKNHDYGEAWRDMRISSYTDMILARLHRIKQIEDNQGETFDSEGIDANYKDIVNYAIFAMIQLSEQKTAI